MSLSDILVERKLKSYLEIYPISKALITYFAMIMVAYIFLHVTMKMPDDLALLFVHSLFPAIITYGLHRFVFKSGHNNEKEPGRNTVV